MDKAIKLFQICGVGLLLVGLDAEGRVWVFKNTSEGTVYFGQKGEWVRIPSPMVKGDEVTQPPADCL